MIQYSLPGKDDAQVTLCSFVVAFPIMATTVDKNTPYKRFERQWKENVGQEVNLLFKL